MPDPRLERLDDTAFRRVLAVAAHPDDVEYGCSAVFSRWVREGVAVTYLLLTAGEAGMQRPPEEAREVRIAEQRAACEAVGVEDLIVLAHPDGILMPTLALRRDIARVIRRVRPDVVVTGSWDVEVPWGLNQADHRAAGLSTLDAVRDADNTWVFPELAADEGLAKWGVTWLLVTGASEPTHAVEVSQADTDAAVASLSAHRAYLADLPEHPAPGELVPAVLSAAGQRLGTRYAAAFRAYRLR